MSEYKWQSPTMLEAERIRKEREESEMMEKEPSLKPCPFCGMEARIDKFGSVVVVGCDTIGCFCNIGSNPIFKTKDEATKAWNKRSVEETPLVWDEKAGTVRRL